MTKSILFSSYIDEREISTVPSQIAQEGTDNHYRYAITIPFKQRPIDKTAIVIMKNPSKAGILDLNLNRKISDDTIYNVCDYLYKSEEMFSKVIILNLFPVYGSTFKNIVFQNSYELIGEEINSTENNDVIRETLDELHNTPYKVILAWGGYPDLGENASDTDRENVRELYKERIREVLQIIGERETYKVGDYLSNQKFPPHGKVWYDFEPLVQFRHSNL